MALHNINDLQPQGDFIELAQKRHGRRMDAAERSYVFAHSNFRADATKPCHYDVHAPLKVYIQQHQAYQHMLMCRRKRDAREVHESSNMAQSVRGYKAKMLNQKRYKEKVAMKKTIAMHEEKEVKHGKKEDNSAAVPAYLLDREQTTSAKVLSNTIKQKRKEKAGKWAVPLPKVRPVADDEMFKTVITGKKQKKAWKRMVTKATFVGENFTRKPPKYERFIRPSAMRFKKAHVTHPELNATFHLDIIGVKKNPSSTLYTQLGVITKGSILEVNVSELGMVTTTGKVVWGKYAQVTNNPELDGCINAVLLV